MFSRFSSYYEKFADGKVVCIDEEIPFEIPSTWEWCRLSSLFQINPKNTVEDNADAAFIPMERIDATYHSSFSYYVRKWREIKSGFTHFADGDVAFAKITPCFQNRKSMILKGLPNGIGAGTTELKVLRTYGNTISTEYLLFFLESPYFVEEAIFKGTANQQRIISGYLENKLFPIPPQKEQQRIVDIINASFTVAETYSKAQEKLDSLNNSLAASLRKSILQEAIQGKLVPQDPNDESASILLQRIKEEKLRLVKEGKLKKKDVVDSVIYKGDDNKYYEQIDKTVTDITDEIPFDIPDSWEWKRLGNICELIGGYAFPSESLKANKGIRVIRISDISECGFVNNRIVRYNGDENLLTYNIQLGDILMAMTGGTVGKSLYVTLLPEPMLLNQRVVIIRNKFMNKNYMNYVITAPHIKSIINEKKNSTNDNISMKDIYNFLIPVPPIEEQRLIVKTIESAFNEIKG